MTNEVRELFDFVRTNGMSVLWDYGGSRAASTPAKEDVMVTEVINGIITSRPAKKITYLNESEHTSNESEPEIIELGGKSKAASTPAAVNPVREIFEFLNLRKYY